MGALYDKDHEWVHYLTRQFTLFGASIWHRWYSSEKTEKILGSSMPDVLFLEEHNDIVRHYREKAQLDMFMAMVKEFLVKHPDYCVTLLEKAELLNKKALLILEKGPGYFKDIESAVDFIVDLAIHSTVMTLWTRTFIDELDIKNTRLKELSEKLRSVSIYPEFMSKIINPLAEKRLEQLNVPNPKRSVDFLTISEILEDRCYMVEQRKKSRRRKRNFIYQIIDGKESILFVEDIKDIVKELENIDDSAEFVRIKGQAACLGKAEGIARIMLKYDPKQEFNEGDILVTISSGPELMPLISRSSAIVTDEGGAGCHAAIISRELKKPCIIGTKVSTTAIPDGALIQVDADNGIVRILDKKI